MNARLGFLETSAESVFVKVEEITANDRELKPTSLVSERTEILANKKDTGIAGVLCCLDGIFRKALYHSKTKFVDAAGHTGLVAGRRNPVG